MLIYKNDSVYFIFIHIPKNGGLFIRNKIKKNRKNSIIRNWFGDNNAHRLDLAHIPYIKKDRFINNKTPYNYYTYTRNPYHRLISAFYFKNNDDDKGSIKDFIKNKLQFYDFSMTFDKKIIHYYPQWLFVCDENFNIPSHIKIYKIEDCENPKIYDLTNFLDQESIELINKIYEKDFFLFGYEMITIMKT
jgi:hypothetical protein